MTDLLRPAWMLKPLMIPRKPLAVQLVSTPPVQSPLWAQALREAVRRPQELLHLLALDKLALPLNLHPDFPLRVPRAYVAKMRKGDAHDPLLRQVLPLAAENLRVPGFEFDPLDELNSQRQPGLLHKYPGRVLLVTTGACAIHCRYCFRRHYPYDTARPADFADKLELLRADSSIHEVIFSGGDPLTLSDERLDAWIGALARIPHLRRIRLHSRVPVVLPSRMNAACLKVLTSTRLQTLLVIHANHANEIDAEVQHALRTLSAAGILLYNQSVLLRGVNDSVTALAELSEALISAQVAPYYLHLLDRVAGAAHFEVPETEAKQLLQQLRAQVSGYLVPQLVREVVGLPYKQPVCSEAES